MVVSVILYTFVKEKSLQGDFVCVYMGLNLFGFFVLMAYQLFLGYLMPKPFS